MRTKTRLKKLAMRHREALRAGKLDHPASVLERPTEEPDTLPPWEIAVTDMDAIPHTSDGQNENR